MIQFNMSIVQEFGPEIWKEEKTAKPRGQTLTTFRVYNRPAAVRIWFFFGNRIWNRRVRSPKPHCLVIFYLQNQGRKGWIWKSCTILDLDMLPLPLKESYSICQWLIVQWLLGSDWRATFIPEQDHGPCAYPPRPNPEKHVLMSNWKGQEEEFLVGHDWLFLTQSLPNIQQTCTYSWLILKSYWFAICDTYTRLEAWPRSTVHDHGGSTFSVKFRTSKIKSCIQLKQFKKQFGLQFTVHLKPGSHLLLATQIMARMHVLFNRF